MQDRPDPDEYTILTLYAAHALPAGWKALVAALAYRHHGAVAYVADSPILDSEGRKLTMALHTGEAWPPAHVERFSAHLDEALRHSQGMPWLDARGVLQFIEAERAVRALGDDFSERMFSAVRHNEPAGWREPLEAIIERAPQVARDKVAELAVVAAAKGLLEWGLAAISRS